MNTIHEYSAYFWHPSVTSYVSIATGSRPSHHYASMALPPVRPPLYLARSSLAGLYFGPEPSLLQLHLRSERGSFGRSPRSFGRGPARPRASSGRSGSPAAGVPAPPAGVPHSPRPERRPGLASFYSRSSGRSKWLAGFGKMFPFS